MYAPPAMLARGSSRGRNEIVRSGMGRLGMFGALEVDARKPNPPERSLSGLGLVLSLLRMRARYPNWGCMGDRMGNSRDGVVGVRELVSGMDRVLRSSWKEGNFGGVEPPSGFRSIMAEKPEDVEVSPS